MNPAVTLEEVSEKLTELRATLAEILRRLDGTLPSGRTAYTIEEAAALLGKSPYTVREWARAGRIHATKRTERRGGAETWSVSANEIHRYQNEGLLPLEASRPSVASVGPHPAL